MGAPVGSGGRTKARGTPVKIPDFGFFGLPFYDTDTQNAIREAISGSCGDNKVCLGFDAVIDKNDKNAATDGEECEITGFPEPGREVPRGTVLKFKVREPCPPKADKSHGRDKTKNPKPSPTPTPMPTPAPVGSG